ncbi:long-chain fatty acid--CoA ligase [Pedobacter sp. P351]|uniref:AMP-dependent synthetase/ligase n=1 Tax=Pedobacter superstes TaxID=3133441 RepID=UPI0030A832CB
METVTRLFDCIQVQASAPRPDLLAAKMNGNWHSYSTSEVHQMITELAGSLLKLGVSGNDGSLEGRDKIGLISTGRPEWVITDLAVQQTGAILVPLYPTIGMHEMEMILQEANVKMIFVESKELYLDVKKIADKLPASIKIFTYNDVEDGVCWKTLLQPLSSEDQSLLEKTANKVQENDVSTIIYTSGTTGRPKGVMLTHKNILSNVKACYKVLVQIPLTEKKAFSFLPLNHIFEKMITYCYLFNGFSIYYAENMETIGANLKEVRPDVFASVPRLLEKVYERILTEGNKLKGVKRKIFYWAIHLAEQYEINSSGSLFYRMQMRVADKLVFSKWRAAIGGNVKAIVLGGAACQIRLEKIFTAANIVIMEGYGLTETSPVIAVNHYDKKERMFGTVGMVIDDVKVEIANDGEVLCQGPNVMQGYYKQPDLTSEVLTDGWFHTGDIGEIVDGKFLKIIDRKKEIFKTAGGKYVAPLPIENKMKENKYIEQIIVLGPEKKFTSALLVPSFLNLKEWCSRNQVPYESNDQVVKEEKVIAFYQSLVNKYNAEFSHVEQVKKFYLLPYEWSIDNGELTPKGTIKRKVIMEKYKNEIDEIYVDHQFEKNRV